jgi:hypothetical protein
VLQPVDTLGEWTAIEVVGIVLDGTRSRCSTARGAGYSVDTEGQRVHKEGMDEGDRGGEGRGFASAGGQTEGYSVRCVDRASGGVCRRPGCDRGLSPRIRIGDRVGRLLAVRGGQGSGIGKFVVVVTGGSETRGLDGEV